MTTLSEKLGLEPVRELTRSIQSWEREDEGIEEDRRATVEAVARWLGGSEAEDEIGAAGSIASDLIYRELLSRPEPEGGRGEGGRRAKTRGYSKAIAEGATSTSRSTTATPAPSGTRAANTTRCATEAASAACGSAPSPSPAGRSIRSSPARSGAAALHAEEEAGIRTDPRPRIPRGRPTPAERGPV